MPLNYGATGNYPAWYAGPEIRNAAGEVTQQGSAIYKLMQLLAAKLESAKDPANYPKYEHPRIAEESPLQERARGIATSLLDNHRIGSLNDTAKARIERAGMHNVKASMAPYLEAATRHPTANLRRYETGTKELLDSAAHFSNRNLLENVLPKANAYWVGRGHRNSSAREQKLTRLLRDSTEGLHHVGADIMQRARETGIQSELAHAGHQLAAAEKIGTGTSREIERDLAMAERAQHQALALQAQEAQRATLADTLGGQEQAQRQKPLDLNYANFVNALHEPERIGHMISSTMAGTMGAVPHETVSTSVTQATPSMASTLGSMGMGIAGNMMRPNAYPYRAAGGPIRAEYNDGGRVALAKGGMPPLDTNTLQSMMQMIDPGMANNYGMMKGFNPEEYQLPSSPQPPMPQVEMPQQPMMDEPSPQMEAPQEESPLQKGAKDAMDTINNMHMQKMQKYADQMETPSESPLGSYLANLGAAMAANQSPELSVRLGQAAPHAQAGYEHAIAANQHRSDTAAKLHMEIQKSIAMQKYRELQANETKRHHQAMETKPIYRTDPVSGGTFQIINGQATPVPGTPPALTPPQILKGKADELKQKLGIESDYKALEAADEKSKIASKSIPTINEIEAVLPGIGDTGEFKGRLPNILGALMADPNKRQLVDKLSTRLVLESKAIKEAGGANPNNKEFEFALKSIPNLKDNPGTFLSSLRGLYVANMKTMAYAAYKHDMYEKYNMPMYEIEKSWNKWDANNRLLSPDLKHYHIPKKTPLDYLSKDLKERVPADYNFNSILMGKKSSGQEESKAASTYSPDYIARVQQELMKRKSMNPQQQMERTILANSSGGIDADETAS